MQYHLDTIPVWEAMEQDGACPLCGLFRKCEDSEVARSLGGSVMEPDERIRVNERGICDRHHQMLFAMQNRLGHALLVDSHAKELLKKLDRLKQRLPGLSARRALFGGKDWLSGLIGEMDKLTHACVICDDIQSHMRRYFYTVIHLWKTDEAFREKWQKSKGLCLPHAAELLRHAQKHLNYENQLVFAQNLLTLIQCGLAQDEKDLEWFTQKFDYRNRQKPWGNSRNALERTVNRIRGLCVFSENRRDG